MRFKLLLAGVAALCFASSALAQSPVTTEDFSAEAFRAHVAFLSDDLLEGREAGSRGYDIAARYVATQLAALGVQPAANGDWYQQVEFVRFANSGTPRLTIGRQAFAQSEGVLVLPSPAADALNVEAPLVFAGYGLDVPARGFNDYDGLDVTGKIVVVFSGYPSGTPSDVGAHLNSEKARMAAARGAIGMITLRTPAENERTPWTRFVTYAARPSTTWVGSDGQPFMRGGLRFSAYADGAAAEALFEGAPQSLDALRRQVGQGARLRGFALRPTARAERAAAEVTRFNSSNVVAVLPGTDPALANEYVLLMAHLDGLGVQSAASGDANADHIRNGAMDNATGIATLIEVARVMSEPGNRPRRPVLIAAVTAEEKGLLGAQYLARNPVVDGRVISVVNLDMPILTYDFRDVLAFGAEHSTMGPIVERAAARMGVRLTPDPLPEESLFVRSDHYRFVQEGVPSVFLMTGFEGEGREHFTGFLADEYHSVRDDMSQPILWATGARFAQLNYLIAHEIANGAEAPRWFADSFFGAAFAGSREPAERTAR